jgi:hypothetical protein
MIAWRETMTVRQLLDKELDAMPDDQQAEVLGHARLLRVRVCERTAETAFLPLGPGWASRI